RLGRAAPRRLRRRRRRRARVDGTARAHAALAQLAGAEVPRRTRVPLLRHRERPCRQPQRAELRADRAQLERFFGFGFATGCLPVVLNVSSGPVVVPPALRATNRQWYVVPGTKIGRASCRERV